MIKSRPTTRAIALMTAFVLSCFGFLLFIWLSFQGPIPFKPKGYRFHVAFPEAAGLVPPVDVRVRGVPVGFVSGVERDPAGNRTLAELELDAEYVPARAGARFSLRQKTLLGETYVEMAPGPSSATKIPEGGTVAGDRVAEVTQIDEILDSFDPRTRDKFRTWQQDLGAGLADVGLPLNDALGNLPAFVQEGADLLELLDAQSAALQRLVRDGGRTFEALSRDTGQLQALARNQDAVLSAIARQSEDFADLWAVAPTFLRESRATLVRLEDFARDSDPFVLRMTPVLQRLRPTLVDLGALAPDLRTLFAGLDGYIPLAQRGLPATRELLDGLRPTLAALHPALSELNPILDWLGIYQHAITDFLASGLAATNAAKGYWSEDPDSPGHITRQFSPTSLEVQGLHTTRLKTNRGNAYKPPLWQAQDAIGQTGVPPAWDCVNAGGEQPASPDPPAAACRVGGPIPFPEATASFPHIERRPYR